MTTVEWRKALSKNFSEYDEEMLEYFPDDDTLSNGEVMDAVVQWLGGLASGDDVRELVEVIYGVNLEAMD